MAQYACWNAISPYLLLFSGKGQTLLLTPKFVSLVTFETESSQRLAFVSGPLAQTKNLCKSLLKGHTG